MYSKVPVDKSRLAKHSACSILPLRPVPLSFDNGFISIVSNQCAGITIHQAALALRDRACTPFLSSSSRRAYTVLWHCTGLFPLNMSETTSTLQGHRDGSHRLKQVVEITPYRKQHLHTTSALKVGLCICCAGGIAHVACMEMRLIHNF